MHVEKMKFLLTPHFQEEEEALSSHWLSQKCSTWHLRALLSNCRIQNAKGLEQPEGRSPHPHHPHTRGEVQLSESSPH